MLAAMAAVTLLAPARAADDHALSAVLARAGDYVVRFERDLSTIVAEEEYRQDVSGPAPARRTLESDLLLVHQPGTRGYLQFRDVFRVDGQDVRPRTERLRQLAANPSAVAAATIVSESARYNIGDVERTINVPVLALAFLRPDNQWRFAFSAQPAAKRRAAPEALPASPHFTVSTEVEVVEYRERERPTIIRSPRGGNVPAHGRFWIEPDSGRVLMSELVAEDRTVHSTIDVSYQSEPVLGFLVPIEMHEAYWGRPNQPRVEGTATYRNFRKLGSRGEP
jgi:hypothetical protein